VKGTHDGDERNGRHDEKDQPAFPKLDGR